MNRREILFRGKRVDNGGWVEGNLTINEAAKAHRIVVGFGLTGDMEGECHVCFGEFHLVDPSTIGQYTGLLDKNGVPIFEGDILGDWNDIDGVMTQSKMQVFWDSKAGAWALDNSYKQDKSSGDLLSEELAISAYEVIGTIHD